MAYIKFKELTHYFNFDRKIALSDLPEYTKHYVSEGEKILIAYATRRDKCLFTERKIVLFDRKDILGGKKKIHFFPYKNISSTAIVFKRDSVNILLTMDSGYQVNLSYVKMSAADKTEIRKIYYKLVESIDK